MSKGVLGLLAVAAALTTACSATNARAPIADESGIAAGDEEVAVAAPPPAPTSPAGTTNLAEGSPEPLAGPESTDPVTTSPGAPPGPRSSPSAAGDPTADDAVALDEPGDEPSDEPSFEAEPHLPIDSGRAALPPDDAGLAVPGDPPAGLPPLTGWAAFDSSLIEELLRNGNTAASVAVSIGGDLVHAAGFGTRTPGSFDPVETQDRFRVASISKIITSVTLLQLVEEGVVGLDEPVGARVGSHLGLPGVSAGASALTVRRLLTHTSGFGDYYPVFFRNGSRDCREAASIGLSSGAGGGGYTYSNMNYCVAGLLIEALTGTSYERVAYERLLTPLGLSDLRLAPTVDPGPDEVQHVTTPGRNYMETLGASGAWVASPTDLVTILDALDPATPGWRPLDDATLLDMLTPVNGQFGQRGYGMGMILYGGGRFGHTGTIENTHAMVLNRGDGVIWAVTVAGPHPSDTPRLEAIVNRAFVAGGFVTT